MGKEKSLRELAREQSLLLPSDSEEPKFRFDLNLGEIVTPKDVEKVRRLVELARITNRGDYISLISLIAEKNRLNEKTVVWHRRYCVSDSVRESKWISLGEWLTR